MMTTPIVVFLMVSAMYNGFIITMVQGSDETTAIDIEESLEKRTARQQRCPVKRCECEWFDPIPFGFEIDERSRVCCSRPDTPAIPSSLFWVHANCGEQRCYINCDYDIYCCNNQASRPTAPRTPLPPPPPPTTPPPTTTSPPPSTACFPSTASLNLENGKVVAMSELQIGDLVPTVSSVGTFTYSKVRAFLKNQHSMTSMYKTIFTSWNNSMTLSGNHLIYARKSYTSKFNPIFADQVSIGDEVLALGSDELTPVKVINMSINQMQGAFMPLTTEGNIVVDGILASCHASTDHDLAIFGMMPMQWFPEILGWLFGKENETEVYANVAEKLGKWVLPYNSMYKEGSVLDTVK